MPLRSSRRLYLRGLSEDVTDEELKKYLSCYGNISEVKLLEKYAFVQFESEADALLVLETYRSQPLLGKKVVIEFAHPLRKDMPSISSITSSNSSDKSSPPYRRSIRHPVVVTDIPNDVRWQDLKDFGRLSGSLVAFCDLDKTRRGRGFIEYFTREDAKRAVRVLDGKRLGSRVVRVVDHETMRTTPRRLGQRRPRSKSPVRTRYRLEDATQYRDENTTHWTTRYEMDSSIDPGYDPLCPYPPDPYSHRSEYRSFEKRDDPDLALPIERVSSWAFHDRRNYDHHQTYEYQPQYYTGDYYQQENRGYERNGRETDRDYQAHAERAMDPYA